MGTVDREGDPLNNATLQWLQQLKPRAVHLLKIGGRVDLKWISLNWLFFPPDICMSHYFWNNSLKLFERRGRIMKERIWVNSQSNLL